LLIGGCSSEPTESSECFGTCDDDKSFAEKLDERNDPIANMLKGDAFDLDDEGVGVLEYRDVLLAMADEQECGTASINTFIISDDLFSGGCAQECDEEDFDCVKCSDLSEDELADLKFPRLVSVVCSGDNNKASEFFLNSVSEEFNEDDEPTGQLDMRDLEMFAWDPTTKRYNFYATGPMRDSDDEAFIEVEPDRCQMCHLTPGDTDPVKMPMTPIMNEINRPWTHWNASPGFDSHAFDLAPRFLANEEFQFVMDNWLSQAAELEKVITFGAFQRVNSARVFERRNAPDLDTAMGMLRPLFCAEHMNYASEQGSGGSMFGVAILDPGLKDVFKRILGTEATWAWAHNDSIVIPSETGEPVNQVPVRAVADVTFQASLISGRLVTPDQVLRARALDWHSPATSDLRCDLWRSAYDRLKASPPDFGDAKRLLNVSQDLFENIMHMGDEALKFPDDKVLVVDSNRPGLADEIAQRLADETITEASCDADGYCLLDLNALGGRMQAYYDTFDGQPDARAKLQQLRDERICHINEVIDTDQPRFDEEIENGAMITRFMNVPALPRAACQ